MSACLAEADRDAGRLNPMRFTPGQAATLQAIRAEAEGRSAPPSLTSNGRSGALFSAQEPQEQPPFTRDQPSLACPISRPFVRSRRLEQGKGLEVLGLDSQKATARMEPAERDGLSWEMSRTAYWVISLAVANMPGGCQLFRIGDGSHVPHPRDASVGLNTSWAVYKGLHWLPAGPHPTWRMPQVAAYGGCLGPGAGINSGEVSAAIGCLREAIHIRRSAAAALPYFNVLYGIDSASCADEMDRIWEHKDLGTIRNSTIAPLVETWVHLRRELHSLGGHFTFVKLPGHGGVYAMAGADACAKACLAMRPTPVELIIHSTLALVKAIPLNPATSGTATGAWHRWAGTPSPHALRTRYVPAVRDRLQDAYVAQLVREYEHSHPEAAERLAIDRVQAGLAPPPARGLRKWTALTSHFNRGQYVYGGEEGAPNSATLAQMAAGGGCIVPGAQVCTCGFQGRVDALHWWTACAHGPPLKARREAAAEICRIGAKVLAVPATPQACFNAIDHAARVLCDTSPTLHPPLLLPHPPPTLTSWREAVLTACGGMPHPGSEAVGQAAGQLRIADDNYGRHHSRHRRRHAQKRVKRVPC